MNKPDLMLWKSSVNYASLRDYLELDSRPIFVTLHASRGQTGFVFSNNAFNLQHKDIRDISSYMDPDSHCTPSAPTTQAFLAWVKGKTQVASVPYAGFQWTAITLHDKWHIIHGESTGMHRAVAEDGPVSDRPMQSSMPDNVSDIRAPEQAPVNLCNLLSPDDLNLRKHCQLVQDFDWSTTSMGALQQWSANVLETVMHVLSHPSPCNSFWGPDRIMLYNEPYISLIKTLHPSAMGKSAKLHFGDFWEQFEAVLQRVETTRQAVDQTTYTALVNRESGLEELTFSGIMMPIFGMKGNVQGIFNCATDITAQVASQRRMLTLSALHDGISGAATLQSLWSMMFTSLEECVSDLPFVTLYCINTETLVNDAVEAGVTESMRDQAWYLQGSLGYPQNHPSVCSPLNLDDNTGMGLLLRSLSTSGHPLHITKDSTAAKDGIFQGCLDRGVGTEYSELVVCPLSLSLGRTVGCLMLGINPLYPYNNEYKQFINLLARKVDDVATSVLLSQKERRRLEEKVLQAEQHRVWLLDQLEQQKREALKSESRFYNFANQAPVGVCILGPNGEVKYANDTFYHFYNQTRDKDVNLIWRPSIHPDDIEAADSKWEDLRRGIPLQNYEYRAVRPRKIDGIEKEEIRYLCSSAYPEIAEDGSMETVTSIVIDVSAHKAHEQAVANDLATALEAKRAQEYFMDMVSHEMRNPLNAMLQCSEEALQMLQSLRQNNSLDKSQMQTAATIIEAIETIDWCGRHQRQIIDDVLTISKLDSNLLTFSKSESRPGDTVRNIIKIFGSDIRASDIDLNIQIATPRAEQPCMMDPSRVLQVLINLVGNSIKFLRDRPVRKLRLAIDVMDEKPHLQGVPSARPGRSQSKTMRSASVSENKMVYLLFSIQDTGPGLTAEEMASLFARFKQASPKTYVQHGGSGLGLFISRELVEMHGGEIGLTSQVNKGSTFTFYVTAYAVDEKDTASETDLSEKRALAGSKKNDAVTRSAVRKPATEIFTTPQENSTMEDISMLIVEDNLVNQKVLVRQLQRLGFKTLTANHGQEALDVLERSRWWHQEIKDAVPISIILCDLEMPVMDGITCIKHIRDRQQRSLLNGHVPIVAVTGNARAEQIEDAKAAGFDEVVCKPFSVTDLVSIIRRVLDSRRAAPHSNS